MAALPEIQAGHSIDSSAVAAAHDAMKHEYDQLLDLWYPYLFAAIHEFIERNLPQLSEGRNALDVGCGTGLQSLLLCRAGYEVSAFDIADDLLAVAKAKLPEHAREPMTAPPLFKSRPGIRWIAAHHFRMARRLEELRAGRPVRSPDFFHANLEDFDFGVDRWDVICCCGSVLSFVDRYEDALKRMRDGLNPGGRLFLEVEQKRNLDLVWPITDKLFGGRLGYDQTWTEILDNLFSRPGRSIRLNYPFRLQDGGQVVLPLWLFSTRALRKILSEAGLQVKARIGVHQLTNLIPSTILHETTAPRLIGYLFNALRPFDKLLAPVWPIWRLGCSAVYCLEKS